MGGNRSVAIAAVVLVFTVLSLVAVSLRCYVRVRIVRKFGWDDGLMVAAMVFFTTYAGVVVAECAYGTGQKTTTHLSITLCLFWIGGLLYPLTALTMKTSICLFLLRFSALFPTVWLIYIAIGLVIFSSLGFAILFAAQCHPPSHFWDPTQPGHCLSGDVIINALYAYTAVTVLVDIIIATIPIYLATKLHVGRKSQIGVAVLLGMGWLASIGSIIRLPFLRTLQDPDFLYTSAPVIIAATTEHGLGIIAGSLATLRPLFRKSVRSESGGSSTATMLERHSPEESNC